MTKEELKQEAEEFTDSKKSFWRQGRTCIDSVKQAYIAGAEPREKQIAELEKENAELKEKLEHRNCVDCSNHGSNVKLLRAKELLRQCAKYHFHPEVTEYPFDEIEAFLKEVSE